LIEYQNKALATKLKEKEEKLEIKSKLIEKLEKRLKAMAEVFGEFHSGIVNLNEEIKRNLIEKDLKRKQESEELKPSKNSAIFEPIQIFNNIINDLNLNINKEFVDEDPGSVSFQLKSNIKTISENIIDIFDTIYTNITYENELKKEIECNLSNYESLICNDLKRENEMLKFKHNELVKSLQGITEERNRYKRELQNEKISNIINFDQLKDHKALIEQLETKNFSLSRKINTHPSVPYIHFEKPLREKMLDSHICVCHICGTEVGGPPDSSKKDIIQNQENVEMKEESENNLNNHQSSSDELIAITSENNNLKLKIKEQAIILEQIKLDNVITENKIISSAAFKNLCSHAEILLNKIDELRKSNFDMQTEKFNISNEKINELKNEEKRLGLKITKLESENSDLKMNYESINQTNNNLNLKIETIQNLIKYTNSKEIENFYKNFEDEKQKWKKQLDMIVDQRKEYCKKYEDEYAKNLSNDKLIINLNIEIKKFKDRLTKYENPEIEEKYQKFDVKERDKMKRDLSRMDEKQKLNEGTIKELKNDLQNARENLDTMINELQVNENGLGDLQRKLKDLTKQIAESNEKMAKMANEKLKDNYTIKLQNEENEKLQSMIVELGNKINTLEELQIRLEKINDTTQELMNEQDAYIKSKEGLIYDLNNKIENISRISEQNRIAYDETLKSLEAIKSTAADHKANYEQMRARYEELFKMKNLNPSLLGNSFESLISENEVLKLENDNYRVILIINHLVYGEMQSLYDEEQRCNIVEMLPFILQGMHRWHH